ncbi:hypothetical protein BY996DRAFT_7216618 [Phakopsora pachyrhizi]|uniref:Uncharacterized protein n=1 Tax=Phakopsora pachyrhizi TaxID=170000 RepID=A0AAV0B5A5_PHAPC|nr:hypothetical protein BY996DRAFT_7826716 [Phakopsora pachyrhizi]KAI8452571.1 hypothetical protein BY996DRAFT_7216618 [Phakopsora pachyrhizi]CAH7677438.1 hypothetical protein PPACK8108_LOCUS12586 [Phakopsora pachyrhizi]
MFFFPVYNFMQSHSSIFYSYSLVPSFSILFNIFGKQTLNRNYHNMLLISDILVKLISLLFADFLRKILLNAYFILVNFYVFVNIQTHISLEHIAMFRAVVVFIYLLRKH